jgi:hypothetical protein
MRSILPAVAENEQTLLFGDRGSGIRDQGPIPDP